MSGISAVVRDRPVTGSNRANAASAGMVYSTPVNASTGAYNQRHRAAATPRGIEINNPNPTAPAARITCSRNDDQIRSVLRPIQSHHNQRSTLLARTIASRD